VQTKCGVSGPSSFFSIVRLPVPYGMLSSIALGCPGLCLIRWLICLFACWWTGGSSRSAVV
jgi:hypothetical protein